MRRGKVQLKFIEDKSSRQVTFSKRKSGILKKAKELSVLCDVEIAVFIFSGSGKLYKFSTSKSLEKLLEQCHVLKIENAANKIDEAKEKQPAEENNQTGEQIPAILNDEDNNSSLQDQVFQNMDLENLASGYHQCWH